MPKANYRNAIPYFHKGAYSFGMPILPSWQDLAWGKGAQAIFVDANGGATADGTSWDNAVTTLALGYALVNASGYPAFIFVAPGTYAQSIIAGLTVTKPNVHFVGVGSAFPHGSGVYLTHTDITLIAASALADNGSFSGFTVTITPTTPVDVIQITDAALGYKIFNNTFINADDSKALTIIDAEADHIFIGNNKFYDCHIAIDNAGERAFICGNYVQDAITASGTRGITIGDGDESQIIGNRINKSGNNANNIGLYVATGVAALDVHDNYFTPTASNKPMIDVDIASTTNFYVNNWLTGKFGTAVSFEGNVDVYSVLLQAYPAAS